MTRSTSNDALVSATESTIRATLRSISVVRLAARYAFPALLADRAEQQVGKLVVPAGADHQEIIAANGAHHAPCPVVIVHARAGGTGLR